MKIVTEDAKVAVAPVIKLAPGIVRLYNKVDGSTVDVHAVDGREYIKRLPHLWSYSPVAKEQAKAEDAVTVPEPAKEEVKKVAEVVAEPAPIVEDKPVSARSRKLAKFED
jgi:hypothetical protein